MDTVRTRPDDADLRILVDELHFFPGLEGQIDLLVEGRCEGKGNPLPSPPKIQCKRPDSVWQSGRAYSTGNRGPRADENTRTAHIIFFLTMSA